MGLSLYVMISPFSFQYYSFVLQFSVLIIRCFEKFIFWSCLFGRLNDPCALKDITFFRLEKCSSMSLLKIFSVPLTQVSSLFSTPITHKFDLLMESQFPGCLCPDLIDYTFPLTDLSIFFYLVFKTSSSLFVSFNLLVKLTPDKFGILSFLFPVLFRFGFLLMFLFLC